MSIQGDKICLIVVRERESKVGDLNFYPSRRKKLVSHRTSRSTGARVHSYGSMPRWEPEWCKKRIKISGTSMMIHEVTFWQGIFLFYLGIWQLKDLKDAMSRAALAVVKLEETKLLLAADVPASFSVPLALFEKAEKYSPVPLVGDAKGLSGRLCSKLQQDSIG